MIKIIKVCRYSAIMAVVLNRFCNYLIVILNYAWLCELQVFFTDSLKFFISLYGHKLPVLSMDISSDGALLASGSADKNIKIWGMDFGDCRKSLFAHGDRYSFSTNYFSNF